MTIVSGIATAQGISALLNAPRDLNDSARPAGQPAGGGSGSTRPEGFGTAELGLETERPVMRTDEIPAAGGVPAEPLSSESGYALFMKAIEALRL